MYIDALCYGIDDIPTITPEIRQSIMHRYETEGLEAMVTLLEKKDPEYYSIVDRKNPKRVLHALEVCEMTGGTYTSLRRNTARERPFNILKIGLTRPREELYGRINSRVDAMIADGLLQEAERVMPFRNCNSLNTVGFKEIYNWMDGALTPDGKLWTFEFAVSKIKQNTRIYSRKQMTWFKRDKSIKWFNPDDREGIINYIQDNVK